MSLLRKVFKRSPKDGPKGEWIERIPGKPPIRHIVLKVENQVIRLPKIIIGGD